MERVRAKRAGERRSLGSRSGRWLPRTALAPRLLGTLVVLVATTLVAASSAAASETLVSVTIIDDPRPVEKWGYAPASRKVPVGSWVTWSNDGYEAHSVTALNGAFDSGTLNPSEGFSWYFDEDGTYKYTCSLHDWMVGTIVVGSGVAPTPTESPPGEPTDPTEPSGQ